MNKINKNCTSQAPVVYPTELWVNTVKTQNSWIIRMGNWSETHCVRRIITSFRNRYPSSPVNITMFAQEVKADTKNVATRVGLVIFTYPSRTPSTLVILDQGIGWKYLLFEYQEFHIDNAMPLGHIQLTNSDSLSHPLYYHSTPSGQI